MLRQFYLCQMLPGAVVDLDEVLVGLAVERPVFHSEADFQQAFAWYAHTLDHTLRVRLETRPAPGVHLDVLLTSADGTRSTAVELKYLTARWAGEVEGEAFALTSQGAQDIRGYDVVKDICRVERFVEQRPGSDAAVVCLTNEASYWRPVSHGRQTNADAFRTYEGNRLHGIRDWGPLTGVGTRRGREPALPLRGDYQLRWRDYSALAGAAGVFRLLVVPVPPITRSS